MRAGDVQVGYRCPRCNGCGTTARPPWVPGDVHSWTASSIGVYECSLCHGTGLVVLDASPPHRDRTDQHGGTDQSGADVSRDHEQVSSPPLGPERTAT